MSVIVLASLGLADLQYVYQSEKLRWPVPPEDIANFSPDSLPFIMAERCTELKRGQKAPGTPSAIALPRLKKMLENVAHKGEKQIERLFLLCTCRVQAQKQLEEILNKSKESDPENEALVQQAKKLLDQAHKDQSCKIAEHAKELLLQNSGQLPLKIKNITILKVGTAGYFDSLPPLPENPGPKDLDPYDFNRADLFDYELIALLKPHLPELGSATLYLPSWGGFPNLHKSLSKVLKALLLNPGIINLYASDAEGYLELHNPQDVFLNLHVYMNRAALEMDWETAVRLHDELNLAKPEYFSETQKQALKQLFRKIKDEQAKRQNWFSNFFSLIMSALYRQDYNALVIWLKCLIETVWMEILGLPKNMAKYEYELLRNVGLSQHLKSVRGKGSVLKLKNGKTVEAKFNEVWQEFSNAKDFRFLHEYQELFYQKTDGKGKKNNRIIWEPNSNHKKITRYRNNLIHDGKPVPRNPVVIKSLFKYLDIDPNKHKNAIFALKNSDWKALQVFEREILQDSRFFSFMKSVAGHNKPNWLSLERTAIKDYLLIIQGKPG